MKLRTRGKIVVTVVIAFVSSAVGLLGVNRIAYHRNHRALNTLSEERRASKNEDPTDEEDRALDELLEAAKQEEYNYSPASPPDYPDETSPDFEAKLRKNLHIIDEIMLIFEGQMNIARNGVKINILEIFNSSLIDLRPYLEPGDTEALRTRLRQVYKDHTIQNPQARASAVEALRNINRSHEFSIRIKAYRAESQRVLTRLAEFDGD